jgi:hypothetical protein
MAVDAQHLAQRYGEQLGQLLADLAVGNKVPVPKAIAGPQLPYLPLYPSDFYGNPIVDAMTDRQQNWYRRLLDKSWQMSEPCFIPKDMNLIAGLCRCTPLDLQGEGGIVLDRFTETTDGKHLFNYRLLKEYILARIPYDARVQAGKQTAQKKKAGKSPTSSPTNSPDSSPDSSPSSKLDDNQNQNQNHVNTEREIAFELEDADEKVRAIFREHPANKHIRERIEIPREQADAILQALAVDGFDLVLAGTRNLADAVAHWPKSEHRFMPNPVKFYREGEYRKDPAIWDRSKPQTQEQNHETMPPGSSNAQVGRSTRNADRIVESIRKHRGPDVVPSGS